MIIRIAASATAEKLDVIVDGKTVAKGVTRAVANARGQKAASANEAQHRKQDVETEKASKATIRDEAT